MLGTLEDTHPRRFKRNHSIMRSLSFAGHMTVFLLNQIYAD